MVDFPEKSQNSFLFMIQEESALAVARINVDLSDSRALAPFHLRTSILKHFLDPKLYAFCSLFFLLNIVSTTLSSFLPIILQTGMGFSPNKAILLSSPPYYYAVIPIILHRILPTSTKLESP